jgi:hypothetical protein
MSTEYDKQQAEIARHRREVEQAAQATALAAQRAAQSAERARLEQNASLQKQEEIAETNSFRNTVLSALPLVQRDQQKQYVLNQIKTRIKNIKHDGLHIQKHEFLKSIGMDSIVETEGLKIESTECFKSMMKSANHLKLNCFTTETVTDVLQHQTKHFSDKEKILKSAKNKSIFAIILLIIVNIVTFAQFTNPPDGQKTPDIITGIFIYIFFTGFPWFFSIKTFKNIKKVGENINEEENLFQKREETKVKFMELMKHQINIIRKNEIPKISGMVFDFILKNKINDEQSFLPPNVLPSNEDWEKDVFTQQTISKLKIYMEDLETDMNKYTFIWGPEMLSICNAKSQFYIAHGRMPQ